MLAATVLLALVPTPPPAGDPVDAPHLEEVLAAVGRTRALGAAPHDELVRQLVGLGPEVIPAVLQVTGGRSNLGAGSDATLDVASRAVLVDVLRGLPRDRAQRRLLELAAPGDPAADPLTALGLLRQVGDTRALLGLLEAYASADPYWLRGLRVRSALELATQEVLEREPDALYRVDARLVRLEGEILPPVVRALGRVDAPGADAVLVDLLGRESALDSVVLAALAESGLRTIVGREVRLGVVRGFLVAPDPTVRRQAAVVLGRLRDAESVEALIALLGEHRWAMDRAAQEALREIIGLDLGRAPDAWERWLADQLRWRAEACDEVLEVLRFGEAPEALRAIRELSSRRLFAPELSRELATALRPGGPGVAAAAANGLGRLGDPGSVPDLLDALEDPRGDVRAAAHRALVDLVGGDRGPSAQAWRARFAN